MLLFVITNRITAERIAEPLLICGFGLRHHSPSNGNPQTFHLIDMQYRFTQVYVALLPGDIEGWRSLPT
ncbi:hypothetical protein llap_11813 [Limosa lapponica baueri]|uniref:Uncharacterized protein n=1 Tax=Limosa lapponica baueri TaxID=1758121 RepID=A0A2I0TVY7_LIMLA|nr:hypothetical protein llap_11813 [Limosa lapponica baueri]